VDLKGQCQTNPAVKMDSATFIHIMADHGETPIGWADVELDQSQCEFHETA
jgi:hypothetical protein